MTATITSKAGDVLRDQMSWRRLRLACGNGLRADVWREFRERFRIPQILEFYAATEGNVSLFNFDGTEGAVGRLPWYVAGPLIGHLMISLRASLNSPSELWAATLILPRTPWRQDTLPDCKRSHER